MGKIFNILKIFGQNFLINFLVIKNIIKNVNQKNSHHILEIGPGFGALTRFLTLKTKFLSLIELDLKLILNLIIKFKNTNNVILHNIDILKLDFNIFKNPFFSIKIIGNIPYYISKQLFFYINNYSDFINIIYFIIQYEVAINMTSIYKNKSYGKLSVISQFYYKIFLLFNIPPDSFNPAPTVISSFIKLTPYKIYNLKFFNRILFFLILRNSFNQKRKYIYNAIKYKVINGGNLSKNINIKRAENLQIIDYLILANLYSH